MLLQGMMRALALRIKKGMITFLTFYVYLVHQSLRRENESKTLNLLPPPPSSMGCSLFWREIADEMS